MSAPITYPGYWLVYANNGVAGVVRFSATGTDSSLKQAVYLGQNQADIQKNWTGAVNDLYNTSHVEGLWEADVQDVASNAVSKGYALFRNTPSGAVWDPSFTIIAAGLGGVIGGALTSAGAAATAAATTGEVGGGGAAEAGAGAAAGGGVTGAVKSAAGTVASSTVGKVAAALSVSSLFTSMSWWKGLALVIGGAVMLILAMRQFAT